MTTEIDLDSFLGIEAQRLTLNLMEELDEAGKIIGAEYKYELALHFLANMLGASVFKLLQEVPAMNKKGEKLSKKERTQLSLDNYATFKRGAQDAIAYGFQTALSTYSGMNVEYYCKITPVPEAKSKLQC